MRAGGQEEWGETHCKGQQEREETMRTERERDRGIKRHRDLGTQIWEFKRKPKWHIDKSVIKLRGKAERGGGGGGHWLEWRENVQKWKWKIKGGGQLLSHSRATSLSPGGRWAHTNQRSWGHTQKRGERWRGKDEGGVLLTLMLCFVSVVSHVLLLICSFSFPLVFSYTSVSKCCSYLLQTMTARKSVSSVAVSHSWCVCVWICGVLLAPCQMGILTQLMMGGAVVSTVVSQWGDSAFEPAGRPGPVCTLRSMCLRGLHSALLLQSRDTQVRWRGYCQLPERENN